MKRLLLPFKLLIVLMPWFFKRRILGMFFGYKLHSTAKIGLSWIFPDELSMEAYARIGHLSAALNLQRIELGEHSTIERNNWINGYPISDPTHFQHITDRKPHLLLGKHTSVTKHHHFDCTESIKIGDFTTIAGYHSQFLTHSIDIKANKQDARPIVIGDYCFVGTSVVVLGGSVLPSYSVLGAKSLLNKTFENEYSLYAGVPAQHQKELGRDSAYFARKDGFVY